MMPRVMTQVPAGVGKGFGNPTALYRSTSAVPDFQSWQTLPLSDDQKFALARRPQAAAYKHLCNGVQADPGLLPGGDARTSQ